MNTQPLFFASQLSCIRQKKTVFNDLSFELNEGELLLIEGSNGSGKSSLLRLLSGLATPASGDIFWQGKSIASHGFREHLHYVGHANGIKLGLTVKENLSLFMVYHSDNESILHADNGSILSQLKLDSRTLASALSAGQKRKLALARLFLVPKKLWILDEPLTALDAKAQTFFLSALENHLANNGIAVMSSHGGVLLKERQIKRVRLQHE